MKAVAIKTDVLAAPQQDLWPQIINNIESLEDGSVVCVASKVVAIDQGRTVEVDETREKEQKEELIEKEAKLSIPRDDSPGGHVRLTITEGSLAGSAGIDRSNGNGYFVLWPKDSSAYAKMLQKKLRQHFGLQQVAVIITDSRSQPLRYGTTGYAIGGAGLDPFVRYKGKLDLFGRDFNYQQTNMYDSLAAVGTLVMGEGSESTPIAVLSELPSFVRFSDEFDFNEIKVDLGEDVYSPLFKDFS